MRLQANRRFLWGIAFALWTTLVLAGMSLTLWQTGTNLGNALLVGLVVVGTGLLAAGGEALQKRRFTIGVGVAFVPVFVGLIVWRCLQAGAANKSIKVGETVIEAIEKYRSERGGYPTSLSDLVPGFLTTIPKTEMKLMSREYFYRKSAGQDSYSLAFKYADWKMSTWDYSPRKKQWTRSPSG